MIWKILFVLYLTVMALLLIVERGAESYNSMVSAYEPITSTFCEIILVLAMVYTFALGWKKRLISEKFNKIFFRFSLIAFLAIGIYMFVQQYTPMYAELLMHGMKTGMVPRHWDFQLMLTLTRVEVFIYVFVAMFVIFAPFYLGYYHYTKKMTELSVAEHSGRKCFAAYVIFSYIFIFISMFLGVSGDVFKFNLFDCLSLVSSFLMIFGLYGYAFNKEILSQSFWRVFLPLCVVIELLPPSFFTVDFKEAIGWSIAQTSPIFIVSSYLMTAVALCMIYRYATTDVVFKTENV